MSLINFSNVTKYYGTDLILDHVSFSVNEGNRIALVGPNGAGKTTILKLILGEEEPTLVAKEDKVGEISILNNIRIGYLNQDAISDINNTVYDELKLAFTKTYELLDKFNKMTENLDTYNNPDELIKYNEFLEYLNSINAFSIDNKIKGYVSKFHFPKTILDKKISSLSGGERMKIAFIKLLLGDFDLLLLDEPTNHLDISTIEWLEQYLKLYKGTILFISHDRYFIDEVSNRIFDLDNHKVTSYNMSYDDYLREKEIAYQNLLSQYEKEEEEMAKLKKFIEFYMPKPRFVGRAKDRLHKLERLEENHIDKPTKENKNIKIKLEGGNLKNKGLLEFNEVSAGYSHPLFKPFSFTLYGKDRLAIVGDNGIGKTTLVKSIMGDIPLTSGTIKHLRDLKIGYIQQNDYVFVESDNCLEHLRRKYPGKLDKELRTALGTYLFKKDDVFKVCSSLSNGERMRLVLCDLSLSNYDVLILDEPTNHLDLVTKECLLESLKNYQGAIIFISHDRYFINSIADYVLYISKDETILNEGNYDDLKEYLDLLSLDKNSDENKIVAKDNIHDIITQKSKKLSNNKINELNSKLLNIENRISEIDSILSNEFDDYTKINDLTDEKSNLENEYIEIMNMLEEN